jgi:hypothetical protein
MLLLDQKPDIHPIISKHITAFAALLNPKKDTPKNAVSCAFHIWNVTFNDYKSADGDAIL